MMSSDPNVQAVISRDFWIIYRSNGQAGDFWRVEVRADGYQGATIGEHAATLEEACAVVVERLQEARDAG
jgi:hypothetical protein